MGRLRYKGYTGDVDFSEEDNCFCGKVLGLRRDCILYEGDSVSSLRRDFEEGIEHYLQHCKEQGIEPEKPYSGKLILRITPDLHGEAAEKAASLGISLNDFIFRAIRSAI